MEQVQDYNTLPKSNDNNDNNKICFINSVYGNHVKGAAMDKVTNVTLLRQQEPQYEFFYFTNLEELETPGWTKVLLDISKQSSSSSSSYNNNNANNNITRHITMSRWPKFLGWKYPPIAQHCGLVVYLDGYWVPQMGKSLKYRMLRSELQQHPYGLLQITHPFGSGIKAEMERIVSGTKDTQEHVDLSLAWLEAQSDFDDNCTLYWNGVFAYDPKNIHFQKASEFFWNRFSLEADSWRDQPLWAYTLHHFGIQPIILAKKRIGFYVKEVLENKGDHHYNETTVMTTTTTTTKTKTKTTNR